MAPFPIKLGPGAPQRQKARAWATRSAQRLEKKMPFFTERNKDQDQANPVATGCGASPSVSPSVRLHLEQRFEQVPSLSVLQQSFYVTAFSIRADASSGNIPTAEPGQADGRTETHPVETDGQMDRDSSCWKSAGKMRRMFSGVVDSLKASEEETLLRS